VNNREINDYTRNIEKIRNFIKGISKEGKNVIIYPPQPSLQSFLNKFKIKIEMDNCKEIILQEETQLELGGVIKKSFSLVYPISELKSLNYVDNRRITLIGPEIREISAPSIDFSMFILIGGKNISENDWASLRQFNFISSGIEGFSIRSVPRRFWCRINSTVIQNKFSFEFLGNAIIYLYTQKFKNLIEKIEIIFIVSYPDVIDQFIKTTSEISSYLNSKWKSKINDWKNRVDCDYDWACDLCPYREECYNVKQVLNERERIGN
jgi:CO dehydrogenase/acetyl-CoA synthase beta subunit